MNRITLTVGLVLAITIGLGAVVLTNDDENATVPSATTATTTISSQAGKAPDSPATTAVTVITDFDRSQLPRGLEAVSSDWITDFSRTTIDFDELLIGIQAFPIRDRIPPIDDPAFGPVADTAHVAGREPGLTLELAGDARFYPLSILTAHEIVNDVVAGRPVAVTFCPLCNSAIVFDRVVAGRELRFGVSGLLRNSDLVMWDNLTESLWQQLTGEGLVGELAGAQLSFLPSAITSYADFVRQHPNGQVLGPDQGFGRQYGFNPYVGYSSRSAPYGFFDQAGLDERFPALERVVNVTINGTAKAYPFPVLQSVRVVNDTVNGADVVIFWGGDTADALDAEQVAASAGIGTGIAFDRTIGDRTLTFSARGDDTFTDAETGTLWDLNGTALSGAMAGSRLSKVVHGNEFWFAWAAFHPDAEVYDVS